MGDRFRPEYAALSWLRPAGAPHPRCASPPVPCGLQRLPDMPSCLPARNRVTSTATRAIRRLSHRCRTRQRPHRSILPQPWPRNHHNRRFILPILAGHGPGDRAHRPRDHGPGTRRPASGDRAAGPALARDGNARLTAGPPRARVGGYQHGMPRKQACSGAELAMNAMAAVSPAMARRRHKRTP